MSLSINASPTKVYIILFVLVILGYGVFVISKSLKKNSQNLEHFAEENPDYKYRLEVMKVFDLYMNRNPTPEEITKYASIKNEQDLLLTILKDFNITASDINKEKLSKYTPTTVTVEEEFLDKMPEAAEIQIDKISTTSNDAIPDVERILQEARQNAAAKTTDTWTDGSDEKITISLKNFNEMKAKVEDLHAIIRAVEAKKTD